MVSDEARAALFEKAIRRLRPRVVVADLPMHGEDRPDVGLDYFIQRLAAEGCVFAV